MVEARVAKIVKNGVLAGWLGLSGMCCIPLTVPPSQAAAADAAVTVPQRGARADIAGGLEVRVKSFSKALDLSAAQQSELKKILLEQRDSVRKIWSDRSLLPAERAPATRAANERTGDKIRAILNDEQKKKYNPVPTATTREQDHQRSVEQWMDATRP